MRKFLSLLAGAGIGAVIGALLVTLFTPLTGDELRDDWQARYERALQAGRDASAKRRAELERELEDLRRS